MPEKPKPQPTPTRAAPKVRVQRAILDEIEETAARLFPAAGLSTTQAVALALREWLDTKQSSGAKVRS